ncbi:MAG: homoserine kinase [Candidatus Eremiobacteraeota bacterium]|nr:homoserine kinase [Candidatus Eremiobacteraeota bacterium]MBV8355517.1 homoserine kinase [Candidatus Eremiobacteraeota bacterium]
MTPLQISIPASSANLGPGYDTIGLALDLRLRATVREADEYRLEFAPGAHAPTHGGFAEEIERGLSAILGPRRPPILIRVDNPIPLGKGLGSSAAAGVLGAVIASRLVEPEVDDLTLTRIVTDLEGHPDNALPALLGGIIVAAQRGEDAPSYLRFEPPAGVRAVVAVPEIELPTAEARAILPELYRKEDTVYNVQRAALLAASFASGDLSRLRVAMADRLHQPYRSAFVPGLAECLRIDVPGLLGIALSGAGPSVLALCEANGPQVAAAMQDAFARHKIACETWTLGLSHIGASVREEARVEDPA